MKRLIFMMMCFVCLTVQAQTEWDEDDWDIEYFKRVS